MNHKAFGASFLYWADIKSWRALEWREYSILWNQMRIYKDFNIHVTFGAGGAPTTLTLQALSTQYTYVAQWTKKYLICMKFSTVKKQHKYNFIDKSIIDLNI